MDEAKISRNYTGGSWEWDNKAPKADFVFTMIHPYLWFTTPSDFS